MCIFWSYRSRLLASVGQGAAIGAITGGIHGELTYMRSTVVVNAQRVSVYRGGSDMTLKTNEYKILKDGTQRGLSVNIDPSQVQNFGGAFRVSNVPRGLQIIQQGRNLSHFEIIARTSLAPDKFQLLLSKIILVAL